MVVVVASSVAVVGVVVMVAQSINFLCGMTCGRRSDTMNVLLIHSYQTGLGTKRQSNCGHSTTLQMHKHTHLDAQGH